MAISSLIPFMHYGLNGSICNEGQAYIVIAKVADCGAVGDEEHRLLRVGGEYAGIESLLGLFVERAADLVEEEDIYFRHGLTRIYTDLFNDADILPFSDDVGDILSGLVCRHVVFLTELVGQGLNGEVAHCLSLFPEPAGGLVESQHLAEVDSTEALTHNHPFAAHLTQHKSFLNLHLLTLNS